MEGIRQFHVSLEPVNDVTQLVRLGEEGVYGTLPELKKHLEQLVASGTKHFLIDTSTLDPEDPPVVSLIGSLLPEGGSVALLCESEAASRVFEITRLSERFAIYSSVDEASAATRSS